MSYRIIFAGLNTALVEKFDFASGTSSRSTKLIHGGVRYLQKAIFNLDKEQVNGYIRTNVTDLLMEMWIENKESLLLLLNSC